jgi:hypothetical protein
MTWVKSYCGGKPNYTIDGEMTTILEQWKDLSRDQLKIMIDLQSKNKDLNEIIYHLRMEIKRLQEVINESKH